LHQFSPLAQLSSALLAAIRMTGEYCSIRQTPIPAGRNVLSECQAAIFFPTNSFAGHFATITVERLSTAPSPQ
jgi:hypothetical protein